MAQMVDSNVGTTDLVTDYDAICHVVQLFLEGEGKGDVAKLREAFHDDAQMFGSFAGTRYDMPIATFFGMAADTPGDTGHHRGRVLSVNQTGDAALAIVAEDGYWGYASFIDYLLLARINGTWKIVTKLFAHTGGEPPASS